VVVLSTSINQKDIVFCYAAGASAYHVKPVRHTDHLSVLAGLLTYWMSQAVLPTRERGHP
jgi:CheY-like chemotaxis protein